jgi:hypothetical protein
MTIISGKNGRQAVAGIHTLARFIHTLDTLYNLHETGNAAFNSICEGLCFRFQHTVNAVHLVSKDVLQDLVKENHCGDKSRHLYSVESKVLEPSRVSGEEHHCPSLLVRVVYK